MARLVVSITERIEGLSLAIFDPYSAVCGIVVMFVFGLVWLFGELCELAV
jgi:hypothetical protein